MSTLKIEEQFELDAPPERVWKFLINPEQIVLCLPGASLESVDDEDNLHGNMKVKVGPVTVTYKGTARFVETDHDARTMKLEGKGREKGGGGTARMTMLSAVHEREGGGSRVTVEADVQLAGRVVRFGRGMIDSVSKQMFKQFTARMAERVASGAEPEELAAAGEPPSGEAAAEGEVVGGPPAPVESEPLRIMPILFKAFLDWITRPFRALFGRKKR